MGIVIQWDPSPVAWTVPVVGLDIAWYGLLFMGGFLLSGMLGRHVMRAWRVEQGASEAEARTWARRVVDDLLSWMAIGAVVGARLVHCLGYDPLKYLMHPIDILNLRQGGLASHGAIAGMALVLVWLQKRLQLPWLLLGDLVALASGLAATCIRLGNFMNQEICGIPTDGSWGVLFMHPAEGLARLARHPVQLYEAAGYFILFLVVYAKYRSGWQLGSGKLAGFVLSSFFLLRMVTECWKEEQAAWATGLLTLGQWLSIPCIVVGIWMLWQAARRERMEACKP
ncbi:MAG: prolipoprotein diacylglyceryl transferase [Chlamydiia bacterium]